MIQNMVIIDKTPPPILDRDGNVYTEVIIGSQTWLVENLKAKQTADGTSIPIVTTDVLWAAQTPSTSIGCCWYDDDESTYSDYGLLYTGMAAQLDITKKFIVGYHVPTQAELTTLITYLLGQFHAGGALKEQNTDHWNSPNEINSEPDSGFNAYGSGERYGTGDGRSFNFGEGANYWSSTASGADDTYYMELYRSSVSTYSSNKINNLGFSIRLIKD